MRFIDEKGRLFGKVNIIDFLVIAFLFSLAPMVYFGYKLFNRPIAPVSTPINFTIDLYCRLQDLTPEQLKFISVGDILLDDAGNNIGEVLSIEEPSVHSYAVDLGGGNIVSRQDPNRRQVLLKARVLCEIINDAFFYKGEKILIGSKVNLKTNKYTSEGIIESEPKSTLVQVIKVKFNNLIPEVANSISVGDAGRDQEGNIIGKVKSIVSNDLSEVVLTTTEGNMVVTRVPINRDVVLMIEALCRKRNNALFFNKQAVKVGNSILFSTDKYDLNGTILSIEK